MTFQTRLMGTVIGNLVAGYMFKQIADFAAQIFSTDDMKIGKGNTKKSVIEHAKESDVAELSRPKITSGAWVQLFICLVIDLVGDSSFLLPGVGEMEDVAWAPLSSFALLSIFGSNQVAGLDFAKEILPFTDILPVATIAWLLQNVYYDSDVTQLLGLAKEATSRAGKTSNAIDVSADVRSLKSGKRDDTDTND